MQIAAPELDGPQQAPSPGSELLDECAWKHGGRRELDRLAAITSIERTESSVDGGGPSHGSVFSMDSCRFDAS